MDETQVTTKAFAWTDMLDRGAQVAILVTVFLLPIIALPAVWLALPLTKMALLSFGVMLALVLWSIARLREQAVTFPNENILWSGLLLILGVSLSALFSSDVLHSFVGFGFERDTVFAMATFVGMLLAVPLIFHKSKELVRLQEVVLASFLVVGILQVARLTFGADTLLPTVFSADPTANLLGSWNDLAVFAGVVLVGILSAFALKNVRGIKLGVLALSALVAVFLLVVVNLSSVWASLAVVSFILAVYTFTRASYNNDLNQFKVSLPFARLTPSVLVLVVSVFFLVDAIQTAERVTFGERIAETFNVAYVDVRPSWEGTIEVGSDVYQDNALFGTGPGTFDRAWVQFKPEGVNQTNFWNIDFQFGIGILPTAFITGGIVGGVLWLLFLLSFAYLGFRIISAQLRDTQLHYLVVSSFAAAAFLWVLSVVYVPQTATLALAFFFTGMSVAAAGLANIVPAREVRVQGNQTIGFAVIGALLVVVLVAGALVALQAHRVYATAKLTQAVRAANTGDFEKAQSLVADKGLTFTDQSRLAAARANIGLLQLRELLQNDSGVDIDAQREAFQAQLQNTISAARAAVAADPRDYNNWLLLGSIYGQLVPLNIEGSFEEAQSSYEQARIENPTSPAIPLLLARLFLTNNDTESARSYIDEALAIKQNYTDAYFLLSQIEIGAGNVQNAIENTEAAALLAPNNPGLFFQLGILHYSTGSFEQAVAALERATTLNQNYANALYFLGLSYDRLEQYEQALTAFNRVQVLNPENTEVAAIVGALETGGSAFDALSAEALTQINRQTGLPINEGR